MTEWTEKTFVGAEEDAFAEQVRAALPLVHVEHDPEFLTAKQEAYGDQAFYLLDEEGGRIWGLAPFRLNVDHLEFGAAGVTLFRSRIHKYSMSEGPVTARPDASAALVDCFAALARSLPKDGVVYVGSVEIGSPLHRLLAAADSPLDRNFRILPWGQPHQRFKIRWDGSYEAYLGSLGQSTRSNMRRVVKKLRSNSDLTVEVRRFRSVDDVDDFLKDGSAVSAKTYQMQLGVGVEADQESASWFRFAAEKGYFLAHILYLNGQPVAFQYGYIFGGTYLILQIGHDPEWSKHQVGMALFAESLVDIEAHSDPITMIDWGSGATMFKERICNIKYDDAYYYLFPRTLRGAVLYNAMRLNNAATEALKHLLQRFKVKGRVEQYLQEKTGYGHLH
jgi:hypothetical protein